MVVTSVLTRRPKYPVADKELYGKTLLKEGATIGANATIVRGNTIVRHALIGADAVVTREVPDHAVMVVVPARQIGWACECGQILNRDLECEKCGRKYAPKGSAIAWLEEE